MKKIFIGGCDRSGTTFLSSMLGVAEGSRTPESQFKNDLLFAPSELKKSKNFWRLQMWGLDKIKVDDYINKHKNGVEILESFVCDYAKKCQISSRPKVWIDHTPSNMRYYSQLLKFYPDDAYFIHIIRDGRAVAASVMALEWGPNNILDAADWWGKRLTFGLAAQCSNYEKVITVYYEELIRNPQKELLRLCKFLRLEYEDRMALGSGFKVPEYTKKQHVLVGKKPQEDRIDAWKKLLKKNEIRLFESRAGDLLQNLGYTLVFPSASDPNLLQRIIIRMSYFKYFANLFLRAKRRFKVLVSKVES